MNKEKYQSSWFEFYKERVGSAEYQAYFKKKYGLFLSIIGAFQGCGNIKEEGIGIGSVARAIGGFVYGSDISKDMLELCKLNNPGIQVWQEDILGAKRFMEDTFCVVTHGVLEHFQDHQIHKVLAGYNKKTNWSVHYVPTDQYTEPSYGDERLLPVTHWVNTFKPFHYLTENQNKELYLIFKHR